MASIIGSEERWKELQADHQEAKEKGKKKKRKKTAVETDLDDIMSKSFKDAKSAIARLNDAMHTVANPTSADEPNHETKPDDNTAVDCRPLLDRLCDMIDWPTNLSEDNCVKISLEKKTSIVATVFTQCKEELAAWLSNTAADRKTAHQMCISYMEKNKTFKLDRSHITIDDAETELENILIFLELKQKQEKERIQQFLHDTRKEHLEEWYYHDLVCVNREHLSFQSISASKQSAFVVSGESGGGKSQYALHSINRATMDGKSFDAALYLTLSNHSDLFAPDKLPLPLSLASRKVYQFLKVSLIPFLEANQVDDYSCLFDMLTKLNVRRNEWAINTLKHILSFCMSSDIGDWMLSDVGSPELTSLLVIIDEVGISLEFAHGLIDSVWTLQQSVFSFQAESVGLVLCGTGIEDVTCSNLATNHPVLGTDPSKSIVTMIGQPNLSFFKEMPVEDKPKGCDCWDNDIRNAIWDCMNEEGSRTQIMGTNMRLLRRGIMPALTSSIVLHEFETFHGDQSHRRLKEHLMRIQKNDDYMEFAVRMYASLNGLKRIDTATRSMYLNHAFLYSLCKSLKDSMSSVSKASQKSAAVYQNVIGLITETLTDDCIKNIMTVGLVTSDPTRTSPAMKYLACIGFSLHVLPGEWRRFEYLVACHLHRYYSSMGRNASRCILKTQVPPHGQTVKVGEAFAKVHKEMVGVDVLVILQPRENNAAGPDIIVLDKISEKDYQLDLYQVKHLQVSFNFNVEKVKKSSFCLPTYCENAEALEKGLKAKIRSRFLQLSSQASKLGTSAKYNGNGFCVLSLEALQPTWDAYQIKNMDRWEHEAKEQTLMAENF